MEQQERKPRVAITHGDTNGVGYEVILKTFAEPAILELCTPIVYGSPKVAAYHNKALGLETPFTIISDASEAKDEQLNMLTTFDEEVKIDLGQPTPESAQAALTALDRALDDYQKGLFDVLVTAPVFKNNIPNFKGHTAYIEEKIGEGKHGLTILMNDDLRVALVTNNVAIKDVAEAITKQKIIEKGQLLHEALRRDLRVSSPRIAVLSLNPRCGEDGVLGTEEQEIIIPAINELVGQGLGVRSLRRRRLFRPKQLFPLRRRAGHVPRPGPDAFQGSGLRERRALHHRSALGAHGPLPRGQLHGSRKGSHRRAVAPQCHLHRYRRVAQPPGLRRAAKEPSAQAIPRAA